MTGTAKQDAMRLDKFLSQQLEISRAVAGRELRARHVTVNGEVVRDGAFKLLPDHRVDYQGRQLQHIGLRYFMLNKPLSCVCSTVDSDHISILSFINEPRAYKLHAAGRLDVDSTGLVLLTDDGQWSHRITSPRHHCEKTYLVTLSSALRGDEEAQLAAGIQLRGEKTLTKPARMEIVSATAVRLTISEGRYHQVKRMFAALGNHVSALHRERTDNIILDTQLAAGEYRPLTREEIATISTPR